MAGAARGSYQKGIPAFNQLSRGIGRSPGVSGRAVTRRPPAETVYFDIPARTTLYRRDNRPRHAVPPDRRPRRLGRHL